MMDIKQKLKQNEAVIIEADEGYSVIIFRETDGGEQYNGPFTRTTSCV